MPVSFGRDLLIDDQLRTAVVVDVVPPPQHGDVGSGNVTEGSEPQRPHQTEQAEPHGEWALLRMALLAAVKKRPQQ